MPQLFSWNACRDTPLDCANRATSQFPSFLTHAGDKVPGFLQQFLLFRRVIGLAKLIREGVDQLRALFEKRQREFVLQRQRDQGGVRPE
jgi:hypothetical protein